MAYIYKSPNSQASEINPDEEEQQGPVRLAGSASVGAYLDSQKAPAPAVAASQPSVQAPMAPQPSQSLTTQDTSDYLGEKNEQGGNVFNSTWKNPSLESRGNEVYKEFRNNHKNWEHDDAKLFYDYANSKYGDEKDAWLPMYTNLYQGQKGFYQPMPAQQVEMAGPQTPGFGITNSVPLNTMLKSGAGLSPVERQQLLGSIQPADILNKLKK